MSGGSDRLLDGNEGYGGGGGGGGGARNDATPQNWRLSVCLNSSKSSLTPRVWSSSSSFSSSEDSISLLLRTTSLSALGGVGDPLSLSWGTASFSASPSSLRRRESPRERASHDIFFLNFLFFFLELKNSDGLKNKKIKRTGTFEKSTGKSGGVIHWFLNYRYRCSWSLWDSDTCSFFPGKTSEIFYPARDDKG